jgi:surfeit locus 1 family protein
MTFRPYPVLTLLMLPALALLLALGAWQVQRMAWKQSELAAYETARQSPAPDLDAALCGPEPLRGTPLRFPPEDEGPRVRISGVDASNRPGWRVFTLAAAPACLEAEFVLVERAFDPLRDNGGAPDFVTAWRADEPMLPGAFTPPGDDGTRDFYAYDRDAIAAALGIEPAALSADWWVARDDGEPPAHLAQTPPERHLAYAVTWFFMAFALIGVWLAFNISRGRISLRR